MSVATERPAEPSQPSQPFGTRRVLLLVFGSIATLLALALLAGGGAAVWGLTKRDDAGFFSTGTNRVSTAAYALATDTLDMGPHAPGWFGEDFATVRIQATSARPVFIGIAPAGDVGRYLGQVRHAQITDFDTDPFRVTSHIVPGSARPAPPGSESFWRVRASGSGRQTITWPLEKGSWAAVAMNADGSRNVSIGLRLGARVPALKWVAIGVLAGGALVLLLGVWLIYLGARSPRPDSVSGAVPPVEPG